MAVKTSEREKIAKILRILAKQWPEPIPPLNFSNPFESLIATMLSAQCTDVCVNKVTPDLFTAAQNPLKMYALGRKKLISYIRSTGFFNAKSKNILATCKSLIDDFDGEVPNDFEELQKLTGVGRKTASVVMCQAFHVPAFPVDRHVMRVSHRLGLSKAKTADKTDIDLRKKIPKKNWIDAHLQLVFLGRSWCRPKPKCAECPLRSVCPTGNASKMATFL